MSPSPSREHGDEVYIPLRLGISTFVATRTAAHANGAAREHSRGIPMLTQTRAGVAEYLAAERRRGRLVPGADAEALALGIVGGAHLMFSRSTAMLPDAFALEELVESRIDRDLADLVDDDLSLSA